MRWQHITLILIVIVSNTFVQIPYANGLFENFYGAKKPCLASTESQVKSGYLTYQNSEHKLQLQYPSSWAKEDGNGKFTSGGSTLWSLATFQPDTPEGYKSQLELEINALSTYPGDLKSISGLADFEDENILLSPEAKILSSHEIQVNSCPGYETVYLQGVPNKSDEWKIMQTFLIDCDKEYVLRFTGTDSGVYEEYLRTMNDIVQSFKIEAC